MDSDFVFHKAGEPLSYRTIQYNYKWALKKAELDIEGFSGTHFLRYSMAGMTREVTDNLDLVQAVTGHHSLAMAQKYARLKDKKQLVALNQVGAFLERNDF